MNPSVSTEVRTSARLTRNRSRPNTSTESHSDVSPPKRVLVSKNQTKTALTKNVSQPQVSIAKPRGRPRKQQNSEVDSVQAPVIPPKDRDSANSDTESNNSSDSSDIENNEDFADVLGKITDRFRATKLDSFTSDDYFLAQSSKSKASKASFSTLIEKFDLQEDEIEKIVDKEFSSFSKAFKISQCTDSEFKTLYHFFMADFNLVLYGYGSKRELLNSFADKYLNSHFHLTINGFMDNFKVKDFLQILNTTIDSEAPIYDEAELFEEMSCCYEENELILLIHSVDVLFQKNPKIKNLIFNMYVTVPNIRIIATVDHVNSSLLWSLTESSIFRWLWVEKSTFKSYYVERKFSSNHNALFSDSSKAWKQSTNLHGISQVYRQVNRNSQQIFLMILKNYMTSKGTKAYPFYNLYVDCREEFLVNSEVTLRQHLKEFQYHKLIRVMKSDNGVESITVIIDKDTCQRFLDSVNDD